MDTHKRVVDQAQIGLSEMSHRLTMANIERDKLRTDPAEAKEMIAQYPDGAIETLERWAKMKKELAEARSTVEKCWECETKLRVENERLRVQMGRCREMYVECNIDTRGIDRALAKEEPK